jgi:phosphoribosyl 1,2-cyclic phosphodiesterase
VRLTLLGSGSSGNVAYVEARRTRVLVDAGLNKRALVARLAELSPPVSLDEIDAVLVTHDHNDHAGCAAQLGRPLFATAGTRRACEMEATRVLAGQPFTVGALQVTPVGIPHDAVETVAYVVSDGRTSVGVLTDCGHDAPEVARAFAGVDVMVLEANHDAALLRTGPYPFSIKRRVGGRLGHLSNEQAASLLRMMLQAGRAPRLVVAAHLSQANNTPELARRALAQVLGRRGRVIVARPRGTPVIVVDETQVVVEPEHHEQLSFAFHHQEQVI